MGLLGCDKDDFNDNDFEKSVSEEIKRLKKRKESVTEDDFLHIVAAVFVGSRRQELEIQDLLKLIKDQEFALSVFANKAGKLTSEIKVAILEQAAEYKNQAAKALLQGIAISAYARARKAAKAKVANDPKQVEKAFVHDCWLDWQQNPERYTSQAKFAKDMLGKCEKLESQAVIEKWCRAWKKAKAH